VNIRGSWGGVSLLLVLLGGVACTGGEATETVTRADAAVPSYAPPDDAPGFCLMLAGSPHVDRVATAIGTLAARPGDAEAKLDLATATDLFAAVREEIGTDEERARLGDALDDLVAALSDAGSGDVTETLRKAISSRLEDVGRLVQSDCDFPT
jgi:hypothetical protein